MHVEAEVGDEEQEILVARVASDKPQVFVSSLAEAKADAQKHQHRLNNISGQWLSMQHKFQL